MSRFRDQRELPVGPEYAPPSEANQATKKRAAFYKAGPMEHVVSAWTDPSAINGPQMRAL
jgi:hypothetical protein